MRYCLLQCIIPGPYGHLLPLTEDNELFCLYHLLDVVNHTLKVLKQAVQVECVSSRAVNSKIFVDLCSCTYIITQTDTTKRITIMRMLPMGNSFNFCTWRRMRIKTDCLHMCSVQACPCTCVRTEVVDCALYMNIYVSDYVTCSVRVYILSVLLCRKHILWVWRLASHLISTGLTQAVE